jgi:SAM-dependent methyltransferase
MAAAPAQTTDRTIFESLYAGGAPWDIGKPQAALIDVADQIDGSVLDAGCGTGDIALLLASKGRRVTGIDFLEEPIRRAKKKAADRGLAATFLVLDALTLKDWSERFDNVVDCGLFHCFSDDDRPKYVAGLANVLKPGGRLFLMCFSDEEPGTEGPRRISKRELREVFSAGWDIESIKPIHIEVRPDLKDFTFSPGGPKAWFATFRRKAESRGQDNG